MALNKPQKGHLFTVLRAENKKAVLPCLTSVVHAHVPQVTQVFHCFSHVCE